MKDTWQIILAGEGGQGLIVAGIILAKAAVKDGKNAVQGQSYGIQSRGGYSQAEVVIAQGDIYYPKCNRPDVLVALTADAYERYWANLPENCLVIYEEAAVKSRRGQNDIPFPFKETALDLGNERVINTLALGVLLRHCPAVSRESLKAAIMEELPSKIHEINLRAFAVGCGEGL